MQPPNMISTKDFAYLEDMLNWNFLAMKKAHFLSDHVQDEQIKQQLNEVGRMHLKHFNQLLTHLQH